VPATWDAGHPDAETLAAYVDRRLSRTARQTVERHASECEDCRDVLADTVAVVHEHGRLAHWGLPFRRYLVAGVAAGLAAAAVALLVSYPRFTRGSGRPAELQALIAAYAEEPNRTGDGRLSGFPYAPASPVTRGDGRPDLAPDTRIAVARIESFATGVRSAQAMWVLGVARLASRDVDGAIASLEEAARLLPDDAEIQSDLSAARLVRGRMLDQRADFERALAAADRALLLRANLAEALFNRAVALEALGSRDATEAWRAVATRDAGTPWAKEAETRQARQASPR
jgi:tetratricopeptide (TPR) repeat protein